MIEKQLDKTIDAYGYGETGVDGISSQFPNASVVAYRLNFDN